LLWLAPRPRAALAGIVCGVACATKVLGGIWFVAALVSARAKSDVFRFVAAAAITGLALLAPLLSHNLIAPTLSFPRLPPPDRPLSSPAWRPRDGTLGAAARLVEIANSGHLAATVLAVIGLFTARRREARFFAVATLLSVAAFLTSSTYWSQYNSHLAASECA